jgi:aspartate/methionine/tyrosine aminotransferase
VIELNSLSKSQNMAGWRVECYVAQKELKKC